MAVESLGYKEGYRVDVDIPEGTWAQSHSFHDILIFNTGHCDWTFLVFITITIERHPVRSYHTREVPAAVGLDSILKHMISFVEGRMKPSASIFLRTQALDILKGGIGIQVVLVISYIKLLKLCSLFFISKALQLLFSFSSFLMLPQLTIKPKETAIVYVQRVINLVSDLKSVNCYHTFEASPYGAFALALSEALLVDGGFMISQD
ncbi:hypothetical protein RHMOL_Rhmol11G0223800 [Rhododendron molle]|uniref:Uncharacterized protein n=1 Tax=Rhododendron molle TaxID=49168 RepID=A0ACC0LWS5_RHOML|nr:hypothetical protein RHMOL_Rhmol11G0223800 [Rhododendron molle]